VLLEHRTHFVVDLVEFSLRFLMMSLTSLNSSAALTAAL